MSTPEQERDLEEMLLSVCIPAALPHVTAARLGKYVDEFLFALAGKSYTQGYFTVYALDDNSYHVQECRYPVNPQGKHIGDYAEDACACFANDKQQVIGFAMMMAIENEKSGLFEWFTVCTDAAINMQTERYIPFTNEDGILDFFRVDASPNDDDDRQAIAPMLEATSVVWTAAMNLGVADLMDGAQTLAQAELQP